MDQPTPTHLQERLRLQQEAFDLAGEATELRKHGIRQMDGLVGNRYRHEQAQIDLLAAIQLSLEALRLEVRAARRP